MPQDSQQVERVSFDKEEVRARMPLVRLLEEDGVELRRAGPHLVGCCPFHGERSPSFTLHGPDPHHADHAHCYGCGWHGDIFKYEAEKRGGVLPQDFPQVLERLAARALVPPSPLHRIRKMPGVSPVTLTEKEKPPLPPLAIMDEQEIAQLAALRELSVVGIRAGIAERRLGRCLWPQWVVRAEWMPGIDARPCWVVGDRSRNVVQFRRLDGEPFTRRDGGKIKAWTKGSPTWPIGAADLGERRCVLWVEGGADMLAAYHFLAQFGQLARVGVVCMLGASMRICAEALGYFEGCRVRIVMDEDEPQDADGKRAGCEASARWTEQLAGAGAAVETFSLAELVKRDGSKVKDLNDLALVDEAAWLEPELRTAFLDFEF